MQQIAPSSSDILGLSSLHASPRSSSHQDGPLSTTSSSPTPQLCHSDPLNKDSKLRRTHKLERCCLAYNPFVILYNYCFNRDTGEEHIRVRISRRGSRTVVRTRLLNANGQDEDAAEWDEDLSFQEDKTDSKSSPQIINPLPNLSPDEELNKVMEIFEFAIKHLPPELSKYTWIGLLGWGGNGFVGEAISDVNKTVAVKFITRARLDETCLVPNDKIEAGIPLEAEIIRRLNHPNIVGFIDIFVDDTYYYLVMAKASKLTWRLGGGPQEGELEQTELTLQPRIVRRHSTPRESLVSYKRPTNPATRESIRRQSDLMETPMLSSLADRRGSDDDSSIFNHSALAQYPSQAPTLSREESKIQLLRPRHSHPGDLLDFLQQYGKVPHRVIKHIILQIVSAYQALLKEGFLYLDFRPENILIDDSFHIILVDFGMSQPILTKENEVFSQYGTLEASAPEISAGEGYKGAEADIWALGLVFYLICSGGEDALPAGKYLPGMTIEYPAEMEEEYRDLICKMLEVDPNKRVNIMTVASYVKTWSST